MPGWPTVGRSDDQRIAEALRRADAQAPARLFDAYAERLYDYACSLAADADDAADAVHDALVVAYGCADRLRDAGRLRPWLYALVRARCAAGARGGRGAAPAPVGDGPDDEYGDPHRRELAVLVHEVLAELGGQEREVLELSLRHGLGSGEVGAVLGLSSRQAATRLGRARAHVENAAAAAVLARIGRAHCPDLSAMVDSWEGPLTPLLRRRLAAHIARCEVCSGLRDRHVAAGRLLDLVPVAFLPLSLRRRVVETCVNPGLAGARAPAVGAGGRFDRDGFPVAAGRGGTASPGPRRRRARRQGRRTGRPVPVIAAAVCVLAATGGVIALTGQGTGRGASERAGAAPEPEPALVVSAPAPARTAPPQDASEPETGPDAEDTGAPDAPEPPGPARSTPPAPVPSAARPAAPRPATGAGGRTATRAPAARTPGPPPNSLAHRTTWLRSDWHGCGADPADRPGRRALLVGDRLGRAGRAPPERAAQGRRRGGDPGGRGRSRGGRVRADRVPVGGRRLHLRRLLGGCGARGLRAGP
ncbi:hypothetical protein GCM10010466_54370 [Planomonospora alba]|uniref:Sigma-70 family RNA polymerase sigma factor n=1 Tax=Planomonospora alba TaxID=161354 RepID=A0ABP6NRK4_9ACTN